MAEPKLSAPAGGAKITVKDAKLTVPDNPILPFIEGDGTGRDIWKASVRIFDAAVDKAFGGKKRIQWFEVPAGEKAKEKHGEWLPNDTLEAVRHAKAQRLYLHSLFGIDRDPEPRTGIVKKRDQLRL